MKKKKLFFIKSLLIVFACISIISCDEKSLEITYYPFSRVVNCKRDTLKTIMAYGNDNRLSKFNVYVHDTIVDSSYVKYTSSTINCVINDIAYSIQLSNTLGGVRAEFINATTLSGSRLFYIEYSYDDAGRLCKARLDGVDTKPIYNHYIYEGNTIIIDDAGTEYRLELSSDDNLGYVCNVLDYASAPITSQYIINSDLYFLNIYGTPVGKLPYGYKVERCNNNLNLSRVGKYYYEY